MFCLSLGALKKNPLLKCSSKEVEMAVSKWLTGARDRDGKRVARAASEKRKRVAAAATNRGVC